MIKFIFLLQIIIATSVAYVWIFRFNNVIKEFKQFGLSDVTRSFVGFAKTVLATLLVVGIWHDAFVLIPSILMGLFMLAAQYFHFKAGNQFTQRLPSLVLLLLCVTIVLSAINVI
jgi:hypothetical protein